jgi:hypothetical protein
MTSVIIDREIGDWHREHTFFLASGNAVDYLDSCSQSQRMRDWHRTVAEYVFVFIAWWFLTAFVFHGTTSNFLRADSGWYLFLSHSSPEVRHGMLKTILTKSFSGHYTPLAFAAEFTTARLVGTWDAFWKWRQITLLAVLGTCLYECNKTISFLVSNFRRKVSAPAIAVTAIILFQPNMREFVAWPFNVMQLMWFLFSVLALSALCKLSGELTRVMWAWCASAAAYASLNCFGLGIATTAAVSVVLTVLWLREYRDTRSTRLLPPLLSLVIISTLHAAIMLTCLRADLAPHIPALDWVHFCMAASGFIPNFAIATVCNLISTKQPVSDYSFVLADWPYGFAVGVVAAVVLIHATRHVFHEPTRQATMRFTAIVFALTTFFAMVALVIVRERHTPSAKGFGDYLFGARYIVPATLPAAVVLSLICIRLEVVKAPQRILITLVIAASVVFGQYEYATRVYPREHPQATISHAKTWAAIVTMAKECQAANLPIPNVPLGNLSQEFYDWDLKLFEPLLISDLKLGSTAGLKLTSWNDVANSAHAAEYTNKVPALREVKRLLRLQ